MNCVRGTKYNRLEKRVETITGIRNFIMQGNFAIHFFLMLMAFIPLSKYKEDKKALNLFQKLGKVVTGKK